MHSFLFVGKDYTHFSLIANLQLVINLWPNIVVVVNELHNLQFVQGICWLRPLHQNFVACGSSADERRGNEAP